MNFATRLRQLRNEKKISQEYLADVIGVTKSTISMWEKGARTPELETFEAVADYFNVDMDYLKGRSDIIRKYNFESAKMMLTVEEEKLIHNYRCASDKTKGIILGLLMSEDNGKKKGGAESSI